MLNLWCPSRKSWISGSVKERFMENPSSIAHIRVILACGHVTFFIFSNPKNVAFFTAFLFFFNFHIYIYIFLFFILFEHSFFFSSFLSMYVFFICFQRRSGYCRFFLFFYSYNFHIHIFSVQLPILCRFLSSLYICKPLLLVFLRLLLSVFSFVYPKLT